MNDHDIIKKAMAKREKSIIDKSMSIDELYQQLIYAVETRHPDETRHETALRYIKEQENRINRSVPVGATQGERKGNHEGN